jgi:aspartyl-tRNA(Asn)/glutamyl-tRNA(Gln) amidotransferase subunit A
VTEITSLTLAECAAAIRDRSITAVEVVGRCITASERLQPVLNCFIAIDADEARGAAELADAALQRGDALGPLHGVPLVRKDCLYRAGKVATCGSKINKDFRPDITATIVERLDRAGAIELGSAHLAEWAFGATGHNEHFGPCHNPWDTERMPGGSSSGSAAAIAARLCYGSIGTDLGGSIRIPAACCGIVGIKPTMSRVSRYGGMPMSFSMDHAGPLARTVEDCALLLEIVAGADPLDPISSKEPVQDYAATLDRPIKGLRIGISRSEDEFVDPVVAAALEDSRRLLKELGAVIVEVEIPDIVELDRIANLVQMAEAAFAHGPLMKARPDDFSDQVRHRIEPGFLIPATSYIEALALRPRLLRDFVDCTFGEIDVLQLPVLSRPVPTLAETDVKGAAVMPEVIASLVRYTRWLSYLGLPGLSLPARFDRMPTGMQLIGRPYAESTLFNVGHLYERHAGNRRHHPDILRQLH